MTCGPIIRGQHTVSFHAARKGKQGAESGRIQDVKISDGNSPAPPPWATGLGVLLCWLLRLGCVDQQRRCNQKQHKGFGRKNPKHFACGNNGRRLRCGGRGDWQDHGGHQSGANCVFHHLSPFSLTVCACHIHSFGQVILRGPMRDSQVYGIGIWPLACGNVP